MFGKLIEALANAGYGNGKLLEGLQAVQSDEIKLTHTEHEQFKEFMRQGSEMFHGKS